MLRELSRQVNAEIREARKLVDLCRRESAGQALFGATLRKSTV
jgi:hypothetical protein